MMLMLKKMMMTMLCWTKFSQKLELHDYMLFSLSGEDIQQKLNALSISTDRRFS